MTNIAVNYGNVTAICGSVVDICFEILLPSIRTLLCTGEHGQVIIEVLNQLDVLHCTYADFLET